MHVNERYVEEHARVVLEKGIDFTESDLIHFFDSFVIGEDKLNKIAKSIGYDSCIRCNKLQRVTQQYVNAEFVRLL